MIKTIALILLLFGLLQALELNVSTLQEIIQNHPEALKERLILAKYYEKQHNNLKAMILLKEVLAKDPKNKNALLLKKEILRKEQIQNVFREASLSQPVNAKDAQKRLQSYYDANNYQFYSNLYQALVETKIDMDDAYHIKAAYIYLWDARYEKSKEALDRVKQKNNIDKAKIRAEICYYTGDYKCSAGLYEKLYNASYDINYAVKLINSYIYLGKTAKAQRLYGYIYRKYPNNADLHKIGSRLLKLQNKYLEDKKQAYKSNPNFETLQDYVSALYAQKKKEETFQVLRQHNLKNPTNKSLLLEARYLIWEGKAEESLKILQQSTLKDDLEAKLMIGKIYSWNQNFEESKKYLDEVIAKSQNKKTLYNAKKALAFVYMWEKKSAVAKKLFLALKKENPGDKEITEALMELNHDYKGLILLYKNRIKKSQNPNDTKRLAQLYIQNKEPKKAVTYLKKYINENPTDLGATKNLALLLIQNREYYQGFGYLEYYAIQKQDAKSKILLAKNYYWQGFSKEALDVLDKLLMKNPQNKEALHLKAKILKIAPRFTTSNSGATIGIYFDNLASKQLKVADALYFQSHYKSSLMYYENYLQNHPSDYKVRYRYAFALENAGKHAKAEGEFALVLWNNDSDEVKYHYAYNLMKNHKLKKAKALFLTLKENTYKTISPNLNNFLQKWKNDWESLV